MFLALIISFCHESCFSITVKSRNYESRNNELSRYNEVGGDDAVMQVSIEKSRYNELSRNNEVKAANGDPSQLRDFTVLFSSLNLLVQLKWEMSKKNDGHQKNVQLLGIK